MECGEDNIVVDNTQFFVKEDILNENYRYKAWTHICSTKETI